MEDRSGKLEVQELILIASLASVMAWGSPSVSAAPLDAVPAPAPAHVAAAVVRIPIPILVSLHSGHEHLATAQAPAPAIAPGSASGSLTVNGVRVPLSYAYAAAQEGAFDKTKEDIRLLFSSAALSDEARDDVFELMRLAREEKASVVEVVLDASGAAISGAIYAKAFEGMVSVTGMHKFARDRFDAQAVSGRMSMDDPSTFMNVTFQYDTRFSTRIPRPPTAEEVAASLVSPPAQAAAAYVAAVKQGDLSAFLATLAPAAAADYRGADAPARLAQLRADMPPDTHVASVTAKPDGVTLVSVEGHEGGMVIAYVLPMVQVDGGAWKVGKPDPAK